MIPLFKNSFNNKELQRVQDVVKRGMYWANGPEISEFESQISTLTGMKFCLVFNSGTSAGHAVIDCLDIGPGDEVIVPSFTFIATANWCLMNGAKPVFADIETETFGLDPKSVLSKVTEKTKAIMPIHYGGNPCLIEELKVIADNHNLILIEDAAESLGSSVNDRPVGSFGKASIFSFTPTKVISTGEGGAVVTDDENLYQKMKLFRSHGRVENEDYFNSTDYMDYVSLGYNFRMASICAALGVSQMEKLDEFIEKRQSIGKKYITNLGGIPDLILPKTNKSVTNVFQMFSILVKDGRKRRDALQKYLRDNDIITKVYFEPVHKTKHYKKFKSNYSDLSVTEELSNQTLSLPIFPSLLDSEIEFISSKIVDFFGGIKK